MSPGDNKPYSNMGTDYTHATTGPGLHGQREEDEIIPLRKENGVSWMGMKMQPPDDRLAKLIAPTGEESEGHDPLSCHNLD